MSNKIAGVVTKLVGALDELKTSDERQRAIQAALTVFGDTPQVMGKQPPASQENSGGGDDIPKEFSPAGSAWIRRSKLTVPSIEQIFHIDDAGANLISTRGKGKREQTINTYLLTGVCSLLHSGKSDFSDETARQNCVSLGCYDMKNHSKTLGEFENKITGSKKAGWKLTAPGLIAAAALLRGAESQEP